MENNKKSFLNIFVAIVLAIIEGITTTVIPDLIKVSKSKVFFISLPIFIALYVTYYKYDFFKKRIFLLGQQIVELFRNIQYRYKINEIEGFYGRENIIEELYLFHISSKENKRILLSGYGGTGKTTIIKNFEKKLNSKTKVVIYNNNLNAVQIKSNTIIFCDYALENKESISSFIKTINNGHKRQISFVIIERNFAIDYLELAISFDKIINLSDEKYALPYEVLEQILIYNVKHDVINNQYKDSGVDISNREVNRLVDLIFKKLDPSLKRPIFCVIIADIYKENNFTDFSEIENVNNLFDKYWSTITRENKIKEFLRSITNDSEIADYSKTIVKEICKQLKAETNFFELFSSMTLLSFNISYTDSGVQIIIYDEYLNDRTIDYSKINEVIKPILSQYGHFKIKKHLMPLYSLNEFSVQNNSVDCIIRPIKFDLVAAWMFSKTMLDDNQVIWLKDFLEVINEHYQELLHNIFSFAIRADDEKNCMALMWFSENITNYEKYLFDDFNKDIRMCIQEIISINYHNEDKYNACKLVLNNLYEAINISGCIYEHEKETLFTQSRRLIEQNDIDENVYLEITEIIDKYSNKTAYIK